MHKILTVVSIAALVLFGVASDQAQSKSKAKKAAAIAAAIAAVALAAKAASRHRDDRYRYRRHHRRFDDEPDQWYPARGVTCYLRLRACYKAGRGYSARWTRREFH